MTIKANRKPYSWPKFKLDSELSFVHGEIMKAYAEALKQKGIKYDYKGQ